MDLFSLVARLTLDKSDYDAGIGDAQSSAKGFASKLGSGLATAAKVGTAALAAVGTAATAATTALVKGAGEAAAYGDNIDKASQKLGISAEAYQEWDAVLQHSGTSIDSMSIGMKTLASKAAEGSDAFKKLGISQKQAAKMSREDLFAETITALQNVTNENERAQLAQELFGRSAMELGPLLNTSAEDTQAMKNRVHELGGVMSNEAVKAAAAYQDSLQDMQTAFSGMKRGLVSEFLPAITSVMDGITELFTTGKTDKIGEGIDQFAKKLSDVVPRVMRIAAQIVPKIIDAIVKNLPTLTKAATEMVMTLAQGIISELPQIIRAGLEIIVELARGIADALPKLIPTIVDVVLEIVDVLTEPNTLSKLLDAAIAIITALAEGLIKALPKLIEKAPVLIANLVENLVKNAPKLLEAGVKLIVALGKGIVQSVGTIVKSIGSIGSAIGEGIGNIVSSAWNWGRDLIDNFIGGIKNMWESAKRTVSNFAQMIRDFLGFSEPEEGPLSNFHTYAPDMMKLFAKGIEDNQGLIADAIGSAFNLRPQIAQAGAAGATGEEIVIQRAGAADGRNAAMMVCDRVVFARLIYQLYNEEAARVGVQLAGVM